MSYLLFCYSYVKTSTKVVSFIRSFNEVDLLELPGGAPKNSLGYAKTEKSTFINNILYKSHGMLRMKVLFRNSESPSDTIDSKFDFSNEFQANGTYVLEKVYCKRRSKRNLAFANLAQSNIQKGSIKATTNLGKHQA